MSEVNLKPADTTVMLLAAGHGKRMLPLTATTPKPLLLVRGRSLIEHHIIRLASQGFQYFVINTAHLGEQIVAQLGDGQRFGVKISYSNEASSGPLETAGGIVQALPLINSDPFVVVNSDIFTDFPFDSLLAPLSKQGRLVLVTNPSQHPQGDFCLDQAQHVCPRTDGSQSYTFSGIALYNKSLFAELTPGRRALAPIFNQAIKHQELEAMLYTGEWHDIGTPNRLAQINQID